MDYIVKAIAISGGNELTWIFSLRKDAERKIQELKDHRSVTNNFVITFTVKELETV